MKIAVKLETATYSPTPKLAWHVFLTIIYILYIYHVMYTVYLVSHHVIVYAHVYYSLMFIVLSVEVVLLLLW